MAESGLARGLFWKAWALSALLATVIAGARLVSPRPAPVPRRERAAAPLARLERSVVVTQPMAASAPIEDGVLARLALAETASERCELLGRVEASADARVTYAITSVLDRAQLDSVRSCATQALSLQPTPEAGSWLIALSEDPAPAVYEIALRALASRDDVAARAELVEATHSENSELRQSAVTALLKAGREEGFSAALAVLPSIEDPESLSTLIDALGESHDPRALPVLLTLLDDADRASRLHAISALGELGIAAASARLESLLDLGSAEEFRAAAQALLKLEPERALLKLRLALTSTDADRQLFALAAIGNADLPGVVPILREQLDSGDERRARLVLRRLLRKPLPELEAELTRFAASDDTSLQMPALRALERLTTASARATVQRLTNADEDTGDHSIVALARDHSQTAQAELLRNLEDPTNAAFLKTVVEVATSSTVQQLVERASGLDVDAKRDLILGLAQRGDPRFSEVLRAALRDEDEGTRNGAVQGLLQLGDESALADARRMARASDPNERAVAVDLFASHLDPATEVDVEALATDSDLGVVSSALHVLQARAPERILALAMRAFRAAPVEDRSSLLSNLSDLKSEVTRPLNELALREGGDDATAIQAIQALSALEGPESARRLLEVLSDTNRSAEVRSEAASGLRGLGGPLARANRALIDSLSEPADAGDFTCGIPG